MHNRTYTSFTFLKCPERRVPFEHTEIWEYSVFIINDDAVVENLGFLSYAAVSYAAANRQGESWKERES